MGKFKDLFNKLTPTLKKIIGNTGWLFVDKVFRMGMGIFVWVWIARYLGPKDFGLFNYAIAFVALLTPFATLGLDNLVIREIVTKKDKNYAILGSAFSMRIIGGILTFLLSIGIISLIKPGEFLTLLLVMIIAAGTIFQAFDVIDFWFQSEVRSKFTVIAKNIAFTVSAIIKIILINIHAPLIYFAWVITLEIVISEIGLIYYYRREKNYITKWKIGKKIIRNFLKECLPLAVANTAILLYMKIDIVLIGMFSDEKQVGIYAAAVKISEMFYFLSSIILSSAFPVLLENSELFYQRLKKIFNTLSAISYLVIIPVFIFSPLIIKLFGSEYSSAGTILSVHIWSLVFVFLGVAQGVWYIKNEKKGIYMQLRRTLIGAAINIILNIFLIPVYGGLGAAIATLISYAYVGYLSNFFSKETKDIFILQSKSLFLPNLLKRSSW